MRRGGGSDGMHEMEETPVNASDFLRVKVTEQPCSYDKLNG